MPYTEAFIGVCARLDPNIKGKQSLAARPTAKADSTRRCRGTHPTLVRISGAVSGISRPPYWRRGPFLARQSRATLTASPKQSNFMVAGNQRPPVPEVTIVLNG
jgi:hypothetical protein